MSDLEEEGKKVNTYSPEVNLRRSIALRGKSKSLETRAAMHASRLCSPVTEPDRWQAEYDSFLRRQALLDLLKNESPFSDTSVEGN